MKLKTSLMMLAVCSLVPLLIFASVAVALLVQHQRETFQRETTGRAVSAMSAVDAKLRGAISQLEGLGTSDELQSGDLRGFYDEARRILATQPDWLNLGLVTASGEQLIDAILPFGQSAPFATDSAFELAIATGKPAVGEVMAGTAVRDPVVRVRVPVMIDGKLRYVLSVPLKSSAFADLLRAQRIDADWRITLADRNRKLVARIPEAPAGAALADSFNQALERSPQGWFRGPTREGRDMYTAYVTSELNGWVLGIGIPVAVVEAATWHALAIAGGGALGALLFALTFAWLLARRIEAPVAALADATVAMGRGADAPPVEASGRIEEVSRLQEAFKEANRAIHQRQELAAREKAALEREQQALRASDTAKDEFIAMLSHELRNPLGALTGAVNLLKSARVTDPIAAHACEVAERQTAHMARLVEDLLDVSRIVSGKANLRPERFDLAQSSRHLVDAWRANGRFAAHHVVLEARPVPVRADRARVEQIFVNLLDNAVKFTRAGGAILVTVARENGEAVLRVSDDGDGIEAEALPHVFDLFSQGRQGLARRKGGLGIGLAIVKRLTDLIGATVEAQSAGAGNGSTFTVRMPVADEAPVANVEAAASVLPTGQGPRRILVIDDNDDMRQMLRMTLALEGRDVQEASDGVSGLVRAAEAKPDVVLVDVGLPDIDGYEVARRLRARPDGAELRLIALTGYGQDDDRRRAAEAGFDAHLTKPVTPEVLERTIFDVSARNARAVSGGR